jgi:hypothetical protein
VVTARGRRPRLVGVTVANLLPVGGVVLLGWSIVTLLTLYWLELVVAGVFALGGSLFQPPQNFDEDMLIVGPLAAREVGIPVPGTGHQLYVAKLLVTPILVCFFGFVWIVSAAVISAPFGTPGEQALTNATVGAFCTAGTTAVGTVVDAVRDGGRDPELAVVAVLFRTGGAFLAGLATIVLVGAATSGPETTIAEVDAGAVLGPLLLIVVSVKYGVDLAVLYRDRLREGVDRLEADLGLDDDTGDTTDTEDAVDTEATTPTGEAEAETVQFDRCVRPTHRARFLGAITRAHHHVSVALTVLLGVSIGGLLAGSGAWGTATTVFGLAASVATLLVGADYLVGHAGVEYRIGDDSVVAHDTLFDTQLWRVAAWDERALRVERSRLDRLLGTETLVIVLPGTERRLAHLPSADTVVGAFDRDAERPQE